jgi:hypothetical protein
MEAAAAGSDNEACFADVRCTSASNRSPSVPRASISITVSLLRLPAMQAKPSASPHFMTS